MSAVKRYRIERAGSEDAWIERFHEPSRPAVVAGDMGRAEVELNAMREAIVASKREIATLRRSAAGPDGLGQVEGELDAISLATERAAITILNGAEEIESAAHLLRAMQPSPRDRNDPVDIILERVLALYEACNFQDITGQRIRRVLKALQDAEARLDQVVASFDRTPVRAEARSYSATRGLRGPKLPGDEGHVSQSEVDAFFG